jgi:VWFA-related protein
VIRALVAVGLFGTVVSGPLQVFRSSVDAVRVDVLVTDRRQPVGGLTTADFELRDNGVRQTIDDLQVGEVPFSMMLALDASGSMAGSPLSHLQDGARAALEALHPDDRAALIAFSEMIAPATPWTSEQQALIAAIDRLKANGSTSLFDAALSAIVQRDPEPGRRNLLIIFSDGRDTASWLPDFAALDLVTRADLVVYGVALETGAGTQWPNLDLRSGIRLEPDQTISSSTDFLAELAERTGGARVTSSLGGLRRTFAKIVSDFRSRYVLTYTPRNVSATGWHRIGVTLTNRKGQVTARRGYERGGS